MCCFLWPFATLDIQLKLKPFSLQNALRFLRIAVTSPGSFSLYAIFHHRHHTTLFCGSESHLSIRFSKQTTQTTNISARSGFNGFLQSSQSGSTVFFLDTFVSAYTTSMVKSCHSISPPKVAIHTMTYNTMRTTTPAPIR